jgi:hypothetical protein
VKSEVVDERWQNYVHYHLLYPICSNYLTDIIGTHERIDFGHGGPYVKKAPKEAAGYLATLTMIISHP